MKVWCERVSVATGHTWQYRRVDQVVFEAFDGKSFTDIILRITTASNDS